MQLRPYQIKLIEEARDLMKSGVKSILIQSATGSGKTVLTANMLKTAASKGMRSLFIMHRRELIKQSTETFSKFGVRHGIIANGFYEDALPLVQLASIQTLAKRLKNIQTPTLIIWDECGHIAAGGWSKVYNHFPNAFHIGLSATPERLDGQGLGKYFQHMIHGPTVRSLIDDGFLSPYRLFAPSTVNLNGVHTRMGDYAKDELSKAVDKPTITGDAIKHYQRLASGKRALVFCCSVEHSKHVVAQFQASGINAVHVDGETDMEVRDEAIRKFQAGEIKVLSNVELFSEGVDIPSVEVGILLRPTQSVALNLQQIGRTLRPSIGKQNAIILDHAGNTERHGLPDEVRVWSLKDREKTKANKEGGLSVRICQSCFGAMKSGTPICTYCGFKFEIQSRKVEQVDGTLQEVNPSEVIHKADRGNEMWRAQSREQLIALAKERKYKNPYAWAHIILQARQKKKLQGVTT